VPVRCVLHNIRTRSQLCWWWMCNDGKCCTQLYRLIGYWHQQQQLVCIKYVLAVYHNSICRPIYCKRKRTKKPGVAPTGPLSNWTQIQQHLAEHGYSSTDTVTRYADLGETLVQYPLLVRCYPGDFSIKQMIRYSDELKIYLAANKDNPDVQRYSILPTLPLQRQQRQQQPLQQSQQLSAFRPVAQKRIASTSTSTSTSTPTSPQAKRARLQSPTASGSKSAKKRTTPDSDNDNKSAQIETSTSSTAAASTRRQLSDEQIQQIMQKADFRSWLRETDKWYADISSDEVAQYAVQYHVEEEMEWVESLDIYCIYVVTGPLQVECSASWDVGDVLQLRRSLSTYCGVASLAAYEAFEFCEVAWYTSCKKYLSRHWCNASIDRDV